MPYILYRVLGFQILVREPQEVFTRGLESGDIWQGGYDRSCVIGVTTKMSHCSKLLYASLVVKHKTWYWSIPKAKWQCFRGKKIIFEHSKLMYLHNLLYRGHPKLLTEGSRFLSRNVIEEILRYVKHNRISAKELHCKSKVPIYTYYSVKAAMSMWWFFEILTVLCGNAHQPSRTFLSTKARIKQVKVISIPSEITLPCLNYLLQFLWHESTKGITTTPGWDANS